MDKSLDGRRGGFTAEGSSLRGRLLTHSKNPRQWMTEDGRWFLNLNDTAYYLFSGADYRGEPITDADFAAYVSDAVARGITSFRATAGYDVLRSQDDRKGSDPDGLDLRGQSSLPVSAGGLSTRRPALAMAAGQLSRDLCAVDPASPHVAPRRRRRVLGQTDAGREEPRVALHGRAIRRLAAALLGGYQ